MLKSENLFDYDFWVSLASLSQELENNPRGTEHLVFRYIDQYLPALLSARTINDQDHVWLAFWSYVVARKSAKKPFSLSHHSADELIIRFKESMRDE